MMKSINYLFLSFVIVFILSSCNSEKYNIDKKNTFTEFYTGSKLNRIAFPIGGIGAGMFCLEGTGAISHMSVQNRPEVFNEPLMFAAISLKGIKNGAKVLEGQVPGWKRFGAPNTGNGSSGMSWGLPRFEDAKFFAKFPFAYIDLEDRELPLNVKIKGWSPFIPTDPDNSSLPTGAIEYSFENTGDSALDAVFSYNAENFMKKSESKDTKASIKPMANGFVLSEESGKKDFSQQGDFAIFTNEPNAEIDYCWFRGGWFDGLTMVWNTIFNGETKSNPPVDSAAPGASLYIPFKLKPGETRVIRVMMAWYVPDTELNLGKGYEDESDECNDPDNCSCTLPYYKPWYSGKFANIGEVADYWKTNYKDLNEKSELFTKAFYSSTIPAEVTEAIAANLTILKSPTLLRQPDGKIWGWEGCSDNSGCCAGSCTHVWNYAQAIPHLFPKLERTLRETEFFPSQDAEGHQSFRSAIPIRAVKSDFYAAADGQLGGIMKMYRDWRICGNSEWLKKMYPKVVESMDYCIRTWDPRSTGTLEEPHHNTYDIEFWGADGMCTSFYLGALKAISEMGKFLDEEVQKYDELYRKGKKAMETELFDGEYFIQNIQWQGLDSPNPVDASAVGIQMSYSDEALELLKKEGPKYQYGKGCLSDGILGSWIAEVSGLGNIIDSTKITSHLIAVHKYNFKENLKNHANPQRPTYALGQEGGLLLCTWPKGGKLSLPFVYSNEVWTGIEYQVASHLMFSGHVEKGLEIVRACRDRYDGRLRNPFNEYECGHWYARAMASYGMLQGLTGARYDAVDQVMYIDSKIGDFTSFLSTETGFGNVGLKNGEPFFDIAYGELSIKKFVVSGKEKKGSVRST